MWYRLYSHVTMYKKKGKKVKTCIQKKICVLCLLRAWVVGLCPIDCYTVRFTVHELPSSFNNMRQRNEKIRRLRDHTLRNQLDFFIQPTRSTTTDNFPLVLFPQLWNNFIENSIKNTVSIAEFNSKLKCHLLNDLSENFKWERLLCPHCHLLQ